MMVFGAILIFTLILSIFGIIFGLVGFIMFIVGCVTSSHSRQQVVYNYPPAYQAQPQNVSYTPSPNQKFCGACGAPNAKDVLYCGRCGKKFLE